MAAKVRIGYFLEDIAQEKFIRALVARVAQETGISNNDLVEDVRNATRGSPRVFYELRRFLADVQRANTSPYQILIVAIDSNGAPYTKVKDDITKIVNRECYNSPVVSAIPNPYIERWYVMDPIAFRGATGATVNSPLPRRRRKRDLYKRILREALSGVGIRPILGGAEYGEKIASQIDLYRAGRADRSFERFVRDLKTEMSKLVQNR